MQTPDAVQTLLEVESNGQNGDEVACDHLLHLGGYYTYFCVDIF